MNGSALHNGIAIVWFDRDLRINDNSALNEALLKFKTVVPIYIFDETGEFSRPLGGASKWFLYQSLSFHSKNLKKLGLNLVLRKGNPLSVLQDIIQKTGASAVFQNQSFSKNNHQILQRELNRKNIAYRLFYDKFLYRPDTMHPKNGHYYKVFGAFQRSCRSLPAPDKPFRIKQLSLKNSAEYKSDINILTLDDLNLLPKNPDWTKKFGKEYSADEASAIAKLDSFCNQSIYFYEQNRDFPSLSGTSQLSPFLHFGQISPRAVWHKIQLAMEQSDNEQHRESALAFLRQLEWREFYAHLFYHRPESETEPLTRSFSRFNWRTEANVLLKKWQYGRTGYPIVDAGMRQLWQTGWMHNRVRMIVASFLVKHLRIDWKKGEEWFWNTLIDADTANNCGGWQWVAGCGTDAAPYFRIFNPVLQSRKFDAQGNYIRHWLPELKQLSNKYVHTPWEAPAEELGKAGIVLGKNYPIPVVDHKTAREEALQAYYKLKHP